MAILNKDNIVYFSDFDFSFKPHPKTGDITILKNENAVKNSIKNLLLTKRGEILFDSFIGSGLYYSLFEPLDEITKRTMAIEIGTTISNFEPRASLVAIDVEEDKFNQGYIVTVYFNIINTYETQVVDVFLERIR